MMVAEWTLKENFNLDINRRAPEKGLNLDALASAGEGVLTTT
jgi:hypothetical protein